MRRPVLGGLVLALSASALLDLVSVGSAFPTTLAMSWVVAVLACLLVARRGRQPDRAQSLQALGAGLVSAGLTLAVPALHLVTPTWGLAETTSLLALLRVRARRWTGRADTAVLVVLCVAVVVAPTRTGGSDALTFVLLMASAAAVVLAMAAVRRADDASAAQALLRARSDERRDISRDLHDDIAFHVTGIVVTAQAAAAVSSSDPAACAEALGQIERTGIEALTSMRALVSSLREGDDAAGRTAPRWPGDLEDVVSGFAGATGVPATLCLEGPEIPGSHRHAVLRIVRESLTNVRRHSSAPKRVRVTVRRDAAAVHVQVTDDGRRTPPGPGVLQRAGGGFGLVGLRERAHSLGGTLAAGPGEVGGWQVEAVLPLQHNGTRS